MDKICSSLTVFFEDPFWVGICERSCCGSYKACKITFKAMPSEAEVYAFVLNSANNLVFSPTIRHDAKIIESVNPKRMRRIINKKLNEHGGGTKSQEAVKLQYETGKELKRKRTKGNREAEEKRMYEMHKERQKKKHRGH